MLTDEQHFPIYDGDPGDVLLMGETPMAAGSAPTPAPRRRRRPRPSPGHTPTAQGGGCKHDRPQPRRLVEAVRVRFQLNALRWLLAPAQVGPVPPAEQEDRCTSSSSR